MLRLNLRLVVYFKTYRMGCIATPKLRSWFVKWKKLLCIGYHMVLSLVPKHAAHVQEVPSAILGLFAYVTSMSIIAKSGHLSAVLCVQHCIFKKRKSTDSTLSSFCTFQFSFWWSLRHNIAKGFIPLKVVHPKELFSKEGKHTLDHGLKLLYPGSMHGFLYTRCL